MSYYHLIREPRCGRCRAVHNLWSFGRWAAGRRRSWQPAGPSSVLHVATAVLLASWWLCRLDKSLPAAWTSSGQLEQGDNYAGTHPTPTRQPPESRRSGGATRYPYTCPSCPSWSSAHERKYSSASGHVTTVIQYNTDWFCFDTFWHNRQTQVIQTISSQFEWLCKKKKVNI